MAHIQELNIDFVRLAEGYANRWVAIDAGGEVYAASESALDVYNAAIEKGVERPFITFVVKDYGVFAPWLAQ